MSTLSEFARKDDKDYLQAIIENLAGKHPTYEQEIKRRIEFSPEYVGVWYELMVYDFLWKIKKNPIPQPTAPGWSKPDFVYTSNNKQIYIDVASVSESQQDIELSEKSENYLQSQSTSSFATMRESFIYKAGKHKSVVNTGSAYIICLGLESLFINAEDVITCFFGNNVYNIQSRQIKVAMDGEIFETKTNENFIVKYKNVSGILVAQRHFSKMKDRNKLNFWFIQNPYANEKISSTEFVEIPSFVIISQKDNFFQMGWQN